MVGTGRKGRGSRGPRPPAGWEAAAEPAPRPGAGTPSQVLHRDRERLPHELLLSPGPRPWHLPLTLWEGTGDRSQGDSRGLATFHLQPVEHRAAVHHIQHGPAGLQAGENLEDKGGWGRGWDFSKEATTIVPSASPTGTVPSPRLRWLQVQTWRSVCGTWDLAPPAPRPCSTLAADSSLPSMVLGCQLVCTSGQTVVSSAS